MSTALRRSAVYRRAGAITTAAGAVLLMSPLTATSALAEADYGVAPAAPTITSQTVSSSGFTLQFTDNSENEYVFYLESSSNYGSSWTTVSGAWRSAIDGTGGSSTLSGPASL